MLAPLRLLLAVALAGPLSAQAGLRPLPPAAFAEWPENAAVLACSEGAGRLVADGDTLVRVRDGARTELGCTMRGGTGEIRWLAPHADGTTYVAAARGLFMISPDVHALDPLDLRDGAPRGEPLGVHVDGEHRLWVATTTEFGCLHTDYFYGRTFGAVDGLPAPPFTGLCVRPDGELWLASESGIHAFRPGASPVPVLHLREVAGEPYAADRRYLVDGEVPLALEVEDAGSAASLRYRLVGHPLWRELASEAPVIPAVEPGNAAFEVVAMNRELATSAPVTVRVRMAYPFYYAKTFLVPVAAGCALAIVALFVWRARGRGRRALGRALLSAGLVVVLGLQVLAGVLRHGRSWPFVGFSMYTENYHENSIVAKAVLIGEFDDGSRHEVHPASAGLPTDGQWQLLVRLVHRGDAERRRFLDSYNERHPDWPMRALRVQTERFRLTPDGPVAVAPIVLARYGEES